MKDLIERLVPLTIVALTLTACDNKPECVWTTDQRVRHVIYEKCMASLKGYDAERSVANKSKGSALSMVSKQCDDDAYYQSRYWVCEGEPRRPDITIEWLESQARQSLLIGGER